MQTRMNEKLKKAELRKKMRTARDMMEVHKKRIADTQMCTELLKTIYAKNAKVIHTYLPFGSEINIYPLIEILLKNNYTVVCPKSLPKRALENLVLKSLGELEEGRFGTKHPANSKEHKGDIDMFIVPGIAFDKSNYRLGYGSGYYDQFFAGEPKGYKVGICYQFQIIEDFPLEPHDVKLDTIIY